MIYVRVILLSIFSMLFFMIGRKWSKGKWLRLMAGYKTMVDKIE